MMTTTNTTIMTTIIMTQRVTNELEFSPLVGSESVSTPGELSFVYRVVEVVSLVVLTVCFVSPVMGSLLVVSLIRPLLVSDGNGLNVVVVLL